MADEESLELGQVLDRIEDAYCAFASDSVVLKSKHLEFRLVGEHRRQLGQDLVIEVVVVEEELLKGVVVEQGVADVR